MLPRSNKVTIGTWRCGYQMPRLRAILGSDHNFVDIYYPSWYYYIRSETIEFSTSFDVVEM
jgi:hypothetical protein